MLRKNIVITSNGIVGTNFKEEFVYKNIQNKSVIVIDNGTYGTTNFHSRQQNIEKFLQLGASKVDLVTIHKENEKEILNYDVCYMMGGSIANLVELVKTTNIKSILEEFLSTGVYIGESAGGIILEEDVEWYFTLKRGTKPKYNVEFDSYAGLGFVNKQIYPHYNKEKEEGIEKINKLNTQVETLNDGEYIELSDLEITVEMACSVNGLIADEKGNEDFLSERGWKIMLEFLKEYDVLIWGRKTFENVITWGDSYCKDLENINMIILGKKSVKRTNLNKVLFATSLEDCLQLCRKHHFRKIFVSGGAKTNNSFFKANIVDRVILNYNPVIINTGIQLFEGEDFKKKLILEKVVQEQEGIVQVHYQVEQDN